LGRFLSADTIVPNPANPQDLNRYSYVRNNPLRYTDPTGNKPCGDGEKYDCDGRLNPTTPSKPPVVIVPKPGGGGGGGGGGVVFSPTITPPLTPLDPNAGVDGDEPPLYCGGGPNSSYNFFDCVATVTQDLAFAVDIPFAGVELAFIVMGCFGGLAGCAAGAKVGIVFFNVTGGNAIETVLSNTSAAFSVAADASANGITHIGESSVTAISGAVAGNFSPDPILDAIIDGYGAGYNHDLFNGVFSFFNSEPLIRP